MAAFAARLKDAADLNTVQDDLAGVVQQTLEPAHISVDQPTRLNLASAGSERRKHNHIRQLEVSRQRPVGLRHFPRGAQIDPDAPGVGPVHQPLGLGLEHHPAAELGGGRSGFLLWQRGPESFRGNTEGGGG